MRAYRVWALAALPSVVGWLAFLLLAATAKRWEQRGPPLYGAGLLLAAGVAVMLRRSLRRRPEVQDAAGRLSQTERSNLEAYVAFGLLGLLLLLVAVVLVRAAERI